MDKTPHSLPTGFFPECSNINTYQKILKCILEGKTPPVIKPAHGVGKAAARRAKIAREKANSVDDSGGEDGASTKASDSSSKRGRGNSIKSGGIKHPRHKKARFVKGTKKHD